VVFIGSCRNAALFVVCVIQQENIINIDNISIKTAQLYIINKMVSVLEK